MNLTKNKAIISLLSKVKRELSTYAYDSAEYACDDYFAEFDFHSKEVWIQVDYRNIDVTVEHSNGAEMTNVEILIRDAIIPMLDELDKIREDRARELESICEDIEDTQRSIEINVLGLL